MTAEAGNDVRAGRAGAVLIALGVLHTLATLGGAGGVLATMAGDGWWRTADPAAEVDPMQMAVFWSLMFGALLVFGGWLLRGAAAGAPIPSRAWGVAFAVVCLVGALAVPAGGFWFGIALGAWLALRGPA